MTGVPNSLMVRPVVGTAARRLVIGLLAAALVACSPRQAAQFAAPDPSASIERIYVATELDLDDLGRQFGQERPRGLKYLHVDVSIPPTHSPGKVEWPEGPPDAATDFVMTGSQVYRGADDMVGAMRHRTPGTETLVFVHGYNNTFSDAVYRFAQMRADFGTTGPGVVYAWPSAGDPRGYAYDRDSVLYSRDDFAQVLGALTRTGDDRVFLLAHSMGAQLVMETLRQAALRGDRALLNRINGVVLMSPDIDPDVFRMQAEAIGRLPKPFLIFVSQQDRALSLAGFLTGRKPRLGTIDSAEQLEGIEEVRVVDFTALGDGEGLNHATAVTSPAAIEVLKGMISQFESGAEEFEDYMVLDADM
ncbi:MAG: alpha/beta fold hydrolase [Roseovarius sp.]|uniref:alpha/beta hydrolase n=1 Tax=Roseovarius sp. TaxID=1486281 RepID=UPI0032EF10A9